MKKTSRPGPSGKADNPAPEGRRAASVEEQLAQAQSLAAAMPFNANKPLELGRDNALAPPPGATIALDAAAANLVGGRVEVMDFISNQYRHGKTILALGAAKALLERGSIPATLAGGDPDPGIVLGGAGKAGPAVAAFIVALGRHRHPEREAGSRSPG